MTENCSNDDNAETYFSHKDRMFPDLVDGKIPTVLFWVNSETEFYRFWIGTFLSKFRNILNSTGSESGA